MVPETQLRAFRPPLRTPASLYQRDAGWDLSHAQVRGLARHPDTHDLDKIKPIALSHSDKTYLIDNCCNDKV